MKRRGWSPYTSYAFVVILTLVFGLSTTASWAASGVVFKKTVTFAQNGTAQIDFAVNGPKLANGQTIVWLEYGSDNHAVALPGPFTGVTVILSKGGAAPITLTPGASSVTYQTNKTIDFTDRSTTATDAPRVWELVITHTDVGSGTPGVALPSGSSEAWSIAISGFPAGASPAARLIASINDPTGNFTNLSAPPKGPSGGGVSSTISDVSVSGFGGVFTATISNGTAGQVWEAVREDYATTFGCSPLSGTVSAGSSTTATVTCLLPASLPCCELATMRFDLKAGAAGPVLSSNRKSIKLNGNCGGVICPPIRIWDRYVVFEPWKKFCPRCPTPCLSCPFEWKTEIPDGFRRALVRVSPEVLAEGRRELSEKAEALKIEGSDFKEIGPWAKDPMTGQSLKLIEYALGAVPRVRLTDGKQTSQEILVADTVDGKQGGQEVSVSDGAADMYKAFLGITAALLLIALVTIVVLLKKVKTPTGSR